MSNVLERVITGRGILEDVMSLFLNIERGILDDLISSKSVCVDILVHDLRVGSDKLFKFVESTEETGLVLKSVLDTAESQASYELFVSIFRSNGYSGKSSCIDFERGFAGGPAEALVFLLNARGVVLSQTPL